MRRRTSLPGALFAIFGVAVAVLGSFSLAIVPESQSAMVVRGGQVLRTYNAPDARRPSDGGAGIVWRVPLADRLVRYDRRVQLTSPVRVAFADPVRGEATAEVTAQYQVTDPEQLFRVAASPGAAERRIEALLGDALRGGAASAGGGAGAALEASRATLAQRLAPIGVRLVNLTVDQVQYAPGAPRDAALARMREAKLVEARTVRADGTARANAVRAEGDAQIAQIERESFGRDPQFYAFYRALQSYETTFRSEGSGRTTWALPATDGYLRHFERDAR